METSVVIFWINHKVDSPSTVIKKLEQQFGQMFVLMNQQQKSTLPSNIV